MPTLARSHLEQFIHDLLIFWPQLYELGPVIIVTSQMRRLRLLVDGRVGPPDPILDHHAPHLDQADVQETRVADFTKRLLDFCT